MRDQIPVLQPHADEETIADMARVLRSGWWGQGPETAKAEKEFAKKVGVKYAVGCNSGTAALDLAIKAYGLKGGELITTPFTFVSDAIVGEWHGMDVTFCDIDANSFCMDPKSLKITKNTKVIIAVDSHGRLADYDGIKKEVGKVFDITKPVGERPLILQDAAHAFLTPGAGKGGDIAIWSFQAVKSCPTGDGGMVTTDDEAIYNKLRTLTWIGVERSTFDRVNRFRYSWDYDITQAEGIKAYMNDLTAVLLNGQMRRLGELLAKRRAVQAYYNDAFKDINEIKTPMFSYTCQYYTMFAANRNELIKELADNGVATSVHFKPLYEMSYWSKGKKEPLPVCDQVWKNIISLPVFYDIRWEEVEHVVNVVRRFYGYKPI